MQAKVRAHLLLPYWSVGMEGARHEMVLEIAVVDPGDVNTKADICNMIDDRITILIVVAVWWLKETIFRMRGEYNFLHVFGNDILQQFY